MFEKGATRTIEESEERTEDRNRVARKGIKDLGAKSKA